jgi:hypothetical protein
MTITIPKPLRSIEFTELTLVELNDVDVDRLLAQLWELIVKQGRMANAPRDADDYDHYRQALAADQRLEGFDDDQGMKVLDGWLRSSIVRIGAKGRGHHETQMDYIQPLTIASYRAGLPKARRHRHVHTLTYHVLMGELKRRGVDHPGKTLRDGLETAIGAGVAIGTPGKWIPTYDGQHDIDINALLSLYFLEQFPPQPVRPTTNYEFRSSAVPAATQGMASDLLDYLACYGSQLSASAFVDGFTALLSLRLFQLPLRIARAARHVINTGEKSPDMLDDADHNPLELYCDFTGAHGSASDQLARQCVQRDLEVMSGFMRDRLLLLSLRNAMSALDRRGGEIRALPMADGLVAMIALREDPFVAAHASIRLDEIEAVNSDEDLEFIKEVRRSDAPAVEKLTTLLAEGLFVKSLQNQVRWFWSTGGITKPYGLIRGTRNVRTSWRYAPTDDLLEALLLVTFAEKDGKGTLPHMPIADLLRDLRDHFGILIDRPPAAFDSVDTRAAAAANLEAFKRRLRLLGCFDSLSDDFSAQYVRNPIGTDPVEAA